MKIWGEAGIVEEALATRDRRIAALEAELAALRDRKARPSR